jgi:hypothetical protein
LDFGRLIRRPSAPGFNGISEQVTDDLKQAGQMQRFLHERNGSEQCGALSLMGSGCDDQDGHPGRHAMHRVERLPAVLIGHG